MKLIITESQLKTILNEQVSNLSAKEQILLGGLNRFLSQPSLGSGEKNKIENVPTDQLNKTTNFEKNRVYPMVQALLIKKNTGKVTYNQNEFNALYSAVLNGLTKEQLDKLYQEGGTITKVNYSAQY